jgi:hypothetical protein
MVFITSNQDFSAASGLLNIPFLEAIYHSVMDETFLNPALARNVVFHLQPTRQQDTTTQSQPAPQQFNPFFGGVPVPKTNTRQPGVKITPRDVIYKAHIKVGPISEKEGGGMGALKDNEAMLTVVIEALPHVQEAISVTVEGRRYSIIGTSRPIGFSVRRYLMVKLQEIQEQEAQSPDITVG